MKCHTGVDAGSGFVHTVEAAANVHDVTVASKLLREDDEVVYGDSAYLGLEKREEIKNIVEAQSPVFPRLKRSRCRSSQEVNDSPTPFSALNYC